MRQLKNPLKVLHVAPTGREYPFTVLSFFDGEVLWSDDGKAILLTEAQEIKAGKRPWLKIEGDLPTRRD